MDMSCKPGNTQTSYHQTRAFWMNGSSDVVIHRFWGNFHDHPPGGEIFRGAFVIEGASWHGGQRFQGLNSIEGCWSLRVLDNPELGLGTAFVTVQVCRQTGGGIYDICERERMRVYTWSQKCSVTSFIYVTVFFCVLLWPFPCPLTPGKRLHLASSLLYFDWSPPWHFKTAMLTSPLLCICRVRVVRFYVSLISSSSSASSSPPLLRPFAPGLSAKLFNGTSHCQAHTP